MLGGAGVGWKGVEKCGLGGAGGGWNEGVVKGSWVTKGVGVVWMIFSSNLAAWIILCSSKSAMARWSRIKTILKHSSASNLIGTF